MWLWQLWKFLIPDLKSLGAKKLYGKLATGMINHINIKILQLILTKVCLMLGVIIYAPARLVNKMLVKKWRRQKERIENNHNFLLSKLLTKIKTLIIWN